MTMPPHAFPAATAAQWRQLALDVLRRSGMAGEGTPPSAVTDLLAVTTYDGVRIQPLYTAHTQVPGSGVPGQAPFTRGSRPAGARSWDVRQRHADPAPKLAREAILTDLENGVTSIWLAVGPDALAVPALAEALDGVYLDLAGVVLDAGADTGAAAAALLDLAADRRVARADLSGNLGADPLGWQARTGRPADDLMAQATSLAATCAADYPRLRAMTVDATPYHDAGGSDAEELGCALATGVAYLRTLTAAGLDLTSALCQLEFRFAATADQFLTIAKLRAARRLWTTVTDLCGAPHARGQRQHAVTSAAMMTARDPWVNLLRTTLACFAAGVGGAQAVTVLPFDAALGLPDSFARRLARNTQSLLVEEAQVARVTDPAGGSWYVERLTEDLAQVAWRWFTEIERAGGMAAALDSGLVARRLAATWTKREANLAHRRDPLTGVSEFPDLAERRPVRTPAPAPAGGGLPRHRYAEAFEALRDRADAHPGGRPTVFLATLGPLAEYTARATFATNLFAAGGITTTIGPGDDPRRLAEAFAASGTRVACLAATDRRYADSAAPAAAALRGAGASRVWLAGPPADYPGVDSYLYAGCNTVAVLATTLADLAVA